MMPAVMNNNNNTSNNSNGINNNRFTVCSPFLFNGPTKDVSYARNDEVSGMPKCTDLYETSLGPASGDDIPNDPGKMFIGGLSWQTTPESIREYFSAFGDLAEVMVMKDPATRRSRGFGFITFSDPNAVDKVLKFPVHQLDGKLVEPKVAVPRKTNPKLVMRTKKIFVGGLSATTSLEDIRTYFEQFSKVKEAMLAYDKVTNRHRGFGFVTFDNEDVVDKICEVHFHEINGKMVESKKALPKEPRLNYYGMYNSPYTTGGGYHPFSPPGRYPGQYYQQTHPHMRFNNYQYGYYNSDRNDFHSDKSPHSDYYSDSSRSYYSKYMSGDSNKSGSTMGNNNLSNGRFGYNGQTNRNADNNDLTNIMLASAYYSNGNSKPFNESSSAGSGGDNSAAYEDDFPELTAAKFSQLRLDTVSPIHNGPSTNGNDFGF